MDEISLLFEQLCSSDEGIKKEETDNASIEQKCPACESKNIEIIDGNCTCMDCSCVVSRQYDFNAEWRNYENSTDISRCGHNSNEYIKSSDSIMAYPKRGVLKGKAYYDAIRVRRNHIWNNSSYEERNIQSVVQILNERLTPLGVYKKIIHNAEHICKFLMERNLIRGDSKDHMIAISAYISFKLNNAPRNKKEISTIFDIDQRSFCRSSKKFEEAYGVSLPATKATDLIMRMAEAVKMDKNTAKFAYDFCKQMQSHVKNSKPNTLAAACILHVYPTVNTKELEKVAYVSHTTFNKLAKTFQST